MISAFKFNRNIQNLIWDNIHKPIYTSVTYGKYDYNRIKLCGMVEEFLDMQVFNCISSNIKENILIKLDSYEFTR